jgi:hypothetical protein
LVGGNSILDGKTDFLIIECIHLPIGSFLYGSFIEMPGTKGSKEKLSSTYGREGVLTIEVSQNNKKKNVGRHPTGTPQLNGRNCLMIYFL